jgi:hypothetical protein
MTSNLSRFSPPLDVRPGKEMWTVLSPCGRVFMVVEKNQTLLYEFDSHSQKYCKIYEKAMEEGRDEQ